MAVIAAGTPAPPISLAAPDGETVHATPTSRARRRSWSSTRSRSRRSAPTSCRSTTRSSATSPSSGATLYGVSCDAPYSQEAFRQSLNVDIEQLSDFEPKGEVCAAFGVLHPGGFPQRALVIVGPDGIVKWSYEAPSPGDLPGANLIFDGLDAV